MHIQLSGLRLESAMTVTAVQMHTSLEHLCALLETNSLLITAMTLLQGQCLIRSVLSVGRMS